MKAKRKTTRKGMTLIEVLIALVIFGMLSSVMVSIGLSIDKTLRATTNLNERVADEAPLMETGSTLHTSNVSHDVIYVLNDGTRTTIEPLDANGVQDSDQISRKDVIAQSDPSDYDSSVTIEIAGHSQQILFEQYSAGMETVTDSNGDGVFETDYEAVADINGGAHLRFFNIDLRHIVTP